MEQQICELLTRPVCPELDSILGMNFPVLDKGFVRVVDYLGTDDSVCQAARVSYGKGTKSVSEDEGLIRYLLRHSHTTPFEMCEIKFHIRIPMDAWRQFIRHRTANVNEYSTRYSEAIDDKQQTTNWRLQSDLNKQGSSGLVEKFPPAHEHRASVCTSAQYLSNRESAFQMDAAALYQERLDFGVAKEQARKDLPLSTYTEAYWKCDLHNLLHFLSLRMDAHAQQEIRDYANAMGDIVAKWVPKTWAAWNDYNFRRGALLLTARDKQIIALIHSDDPKCNVLLLAQCFGWLDRKTDGTLKTNRERTECENKLKQLGIFCPWKG